MSKRAVATIPLTPPELDILDQAYGFVERKAAELQGAHDRADARLYRIACAKGVDLGRYEFSPERGMFVRKAKAATVAPIAENVKPLERPKTRARR